ncbi:MAG: glycosyltransferase family 2 protein [Spirochaetota bacterium]
MTENPKRRHAAALQSLSHLVSVVTPACNEARHIRRVVHSVAAQTVEVREHIIVDDGSTDETLAILDCLKERFPNLVVISQTRQGAAAARNRGIAVARGRYIAFLDANDVWHERKVERQIGFMEQTGRHFTYGDYVEVGHFTRRIMKQYTLPPSVGYRQLLRGCPIGCLTAAYNQEALGKRYMPQVNSGHDWGLWLDLTRDGIRAWKYPGVEAAYSNGRPSLSSRKFRKAVNIYRIYRESEGFSRALSVVRAVQHSLVALAKKAGLLYH